MCNHFSYRKHIYIKNNMLKKLVIRANKKIWQNLYNMPCKAIYYVVTSPFLKCNGIMEEWSLLENRDNRFE